MAKEKRGVSAAILYRDAARASRRWQTYALRTAFSAALLAMVLASIWAVTNVSQVAFDPSELGELGRYMFVAFAVIQVLLATLIAPFAVSQAIIEEREDATMDLLALTYLSPKQILGAKVTGRVLTLLTVILGALPVLGMVVSLGGVSVVEVIAVTSHAMLTVVLLGMLGGFFALFTRSPVLATLASIGYAVTAYLLMPLLYGLLVMDWRAFAHFSPLLGTTAQNWWAMLPILSYMPVVAVTFVLGARLFALRIARAQLRAYLSRELWGVWPIGILWAVIVITMMVILPPAVGGAWFAAVSSTATNGLPWYANMAIMGVSRSIVWVWCVMVLVGCTWLYLRVGMDLVMMGDDLLSGRTSQAERKRRGKTVHVWNNPVMWRSIRPSAWKVILPAVTMWFLALLGVFQTGFWIVPGGLLTIGALNAAAAFVLTLWMASSAIDVERRSGTLQILLTTTLPSWRIISGKFAGIAAPSFTLLAVSFPLIIVGVPHLQLVTRGRSMESAMVVAFLACFWVIAQWMWVIAMTLFLAMRLHNPRAAQPVALGFMSATLFIPPVICLLLTPYPWLSIPFRLVVPVLVATPTWWEVTLSASAWFSMAVMLLLFMALRLRKWGTL
ncbi:MAG: ABC-type transport system involved in multi-copper enzyme maturation permease subunit [Myxococcota bacterium]|jgi:ABC-type transport system involved in multi-copper enzyme maturation permease subunit